MRNKLKHKKTHIILICLFSLNNLFGFDETLILKKDAFVYEKYNFFVTDVIDARPEQQSPIGSFIEGILSNKIILGCDTLNNYLKNYFLKNKKPFNENTKILLVINQINFVEQLNKNIDDFEITLAFDYYRLRNDSAKLEYSQYIKYDLGAGISKRNTLIKLFSEAMAYSFLQFKNQLMYYKPLTNSFISISDLKKILRTQFEKATNQNINDGIYTNINQLYFNSPIPIKDYTIATDSTLQNLFPTNIVAKNYLIKKCFAIVKNKIIYVYLGDGYYFPAEFDESGNLFLKYLFVKPTKLKPNFFIRPDLHGIKALYPIFNIGSVSLITTINVNAEYKRIKIDLNTGELRMN